MQQNEHDLAEFELFTNSKFDPVQVLSRLLQSTNVLDDTELDLETAAKKLHFDAKECTRRIRAITAENNSELINNVAVITTYSEHVRQNIVPQANRIETAYQRIKNEVVRPYEDATRLQSALKAIHATLALLRGAGIFLLFVRQLQDCEKAHGSSDDPNDALRLAKLIKNFLQIYSHDVWSLHGGPDLTSLEIVRGYQSTVQSKAAKFVSELKTKVVHELGHQTSLNAQKSTLQNNLLALYELDEAQLFVLIEDAIQNSVKVVLVSLLRTLQSQRNLAVNFNDVNMTARSFVASMSGLLDKCTPSSSDQPSAKTLLRRLEDHLGRTEESSLAGFYWLKMAKLYKKNILAILAKRGPVAGNLTNNRLQIVESVQAVFEVPGRDYLVDSLGILSNHQQATAQKELRRNSHCNESAHNKRIHDVQSL